MTHVTSAKPAVFVSGLTWMSWGPGEDWTHGGVRMVCWKATGISGNFMGIYCTPPKQANSSPLKCSAIPKGTGSFFQPIKFPVRFVTGAGFGYQVLWNGRKKTSIYKQPLSLKKTLLVGPCRALFGIESGHPWIPMDFFLSARLRDPPPKIWRVGDDQINAITFRAANLFGTVFNMLTIKDNLVLSDITISTIIIAPLLIFFGLSVKSVEESFLNLHDPGSSCHPSNKNGASFFFLDFV